MRSTPAPLTPWLTGAVVSLVLLAGVVLDIDLPGVYMDAVNPDYLAVSILNPGHRIEAWVLPGNMLAGRFPVLTSLYHGTQQLWLGLPFFALLGTTVATLRLVHGLFACAVLICATMLLRRAGLKEIAVAAVGIAVAADPSFVFAFRTPSYITLAPVAWLLLSFLALARAGGTASPRRWLLASGAAYGLAVFGYFIYLFYLPAVLFAVLAWPAWSAQPGALPARWRRLLPWAVGAAAGAIAYPIGYALIAWNLGSLGGLVDYVRDTQQALGVMRSPLGFTGRVANGWHMVTSVTHNWWHHSMMFGVQASVPGAQAKTLLLTAAPIALWLAAEARRTAGIYLRVTVACGVSFFVLSLVFGNRLGGHHYVSLLVLGYLGLALGIAALVGRRGDTAPFPRSAWVVPPMVLLLGLGLMGQADVRARLRETGGVGLMSDAINRFAADARSAHAQDFHYFPDWGLALPFAFLTKGDIDHAQAADAKEARALLCQGRDVRLALIGPERGRRLAEWTRALDWPDPVVDAYRQRDGVVVIEVATYRAGLPGSSGERCRPR